MAYLKSDKLCGLIIFLPEIFVLTESLYVFFHLQAILLSMNGLKSFEGYGIVSFVFYKRGKICVSTKAFFYVAVY